MKFQSSSQKPNFPCSSIRSTMDSTIRIMDANIRKMDNITSLLLDLKSELKSLLKNGESGIKNQDKGMDSSISTADPPCDLSDLVTNSVENDEVLDSAKLDDVNITSNGGNDVDDDLVLGFKRSESEGIDENGYSDGDVLNCHAMVQYKKLPHESVSRVELFEIGKFNKRLQFGSVLENQEKLEDLQAQVLLKNKNLVEARLQEYVLAELQRSYTFNNNLVYIQPDVDFCFSNQGVFVFDRGRLQESNLVEVQKANDSKVTTHVSNSRTSNFSSTDSIPVKRLIKNVDGQDVTNGGDKGGFAPKIQENYCLFQSVGYRVFFFYVLDEATLQESVLEELDVSTISHFLRFHIIYVFDRGKLTEAVGVVRFSDTSHVQLYDDLVEFSANVILAELLDVSNVGVVTTKVVGVFQPSRQPCVKKISKLHIQGTKQEMVLQLMVWTSSSGTSTVNNKLAMQQFLILIFDPGGGTLRSTKGAMMYLKLSQRICDVWETEKLFGLLEQVQLD